MTTTAAYYAVIFVTTLTEDVDDYVEMSKKMVELSKTMPGFLGIESARKDIGITVCYWKDEASIKHWYENSLHKEAQKMGKEKWFKSLKIRIAKVEREYGFDHTEQQNKPKYTTAADSKNNNFSQLSSEEYTEMARANASTFHKNFSTGEFHKNGALVSEKIYVNSNNAIVIGRDKFVERIKRFNIPFPALALKDRVIIVDENQVALLYLMQGVHDGPHGNLPASGNKINVYAAEFFTMDDNIQMKELLTITQLDQLLLQIKGIDKIMDFEPVSLLPIKKTNAVYKKTSKYNLDAFVHHFNSRDWEQFKMLFTADAEININGKKINGAQALVNELEKRIALLPDVTYHLDRNVVEGDRGALAYTVNGIFTSSKEKDEAGNHVSKSVMSREGIHFQFADDGKMMNAIIIFNSDDLIKQME